MVRPEDRHAARSLGADAERAWRGFVRVQAALTKGLDAELSGMHGLPLSSFEVLLFLEHAPQRRMRMADLATSVLLTRSGLSRLVDRLERDGLLRREPDPADGRGAYAVITEAGRSLLAEARPTSLAWIERNFSSRFTRGELVLLGELWERLVPGATGEQEPRKDAAGRA